jgi:hypothetical protein
MQALRPFEVSGNNNPAGTAELNLQQIPLWKPQIPQAKV